jgi:hypothetical protein
LRAGNQGLRGIEMQFTRENFSDVTDTIAKAMENADKMKTVIIIYETYEDNKTSTGGVLTQDSASLSQMNWLIDMAKWWLMNLTTRESD